MGWVVLFQSSAALQFRHKIFTLGKLKADWPNLGALFTDFPFTDFLLIHVTEKSSALFRSGNKYVLKRIIKICA